VRILQVGKYYAPVHGGMERVVGELSEGLAARGHRVRAVTASGDGPFRRETLRGVEVVRLRTFGRLFSQPLISGLKAAIFEFRPDVVHFHLPNPLALWQGWPSNVATCLTLHADAGGIKRPIDRWWTRKFVARADAVLFSSAMMAEKWRSISAPEKIHIIPFGFRFDYLRRRGETADPRLILFVGRLVGYKGIDTLLRAMPKVDGRLVIVGDGPLRSKLVRLARRLGAGERVAFVGAVSDEDLCRWYERASIYVQPSVNECEAFGISMLEAMHMGKPVVSTDLSTGVQAVNRHGVTGLVVPPGSPGALAAAFNSLLRDRGLALGLAAGAEKHQREFSANAMLDRHEALYQSLVHARRPTWIFREPSADIH